MVIMNRVAPPVASQVLPAAVVEGLMAISGGGESDRGLVSEFKHGFESHWGYSNSPELNTGDAAGGLPQRLLYKRTIYPREIARVKNHITF